MKCLHLQVMSITETQVSVHIAQDAVSAVLCMSICIVVQHVPAGLSLKQ